MHSENNRDNQGLRVAPDSGWWTVAVAILLLAAFAVRVIDLEHHPLWWDEGLNLYFAHQNPLSLAAEARITNDTDPPVHRLALGGWRRAAGDSPFAMRFFSVWMGVATVALTWTVGSWLTNARTALLATLLVALSPMQVHYVREIKGYAAVSACTLLSTYAWGRRLGYFSLRSPRFSHSLRWWVVYVFSTAAAVGTHYYAGLLILWQGLWVMVYLTWAWMRKRVTRRDLFKGMAKFVLAMSAVSLFLAPWVWMMFETTVSGVTNVSVRGQPLSMAAYLSQMARAFGMGPGADGIVALIVGGSLAALSILGALLGDSRLFPFTWVVAPMAAAYLMQVAYPFFFPRFLLYLVPPFYILVSQGIAAFLAPEFKIFQNPDDFLGKGNVFGRFISLERPLRLRTAPSLKRCLSTIVATVLVIALIGLWLSSLVQAYIAPADEAEDPRPVVARLRAASRPDDAVVYVYIWQAGYLFSYYPHNDLTLYRAYYTPQTVDSELKSIFASHPRLWLLSHDIAAEDENNLSGFWLQKNAYKVESNWYGRHNLALYLTPNFQTPGVGPDEETVTFDGQVELRYPLVDAQLRPGDALALPLHWQALAPLEENYKIFVHLGLPDIPPLVQSDAFPQNGLELTSTWDVGQQVMDRQALLLPETLPPDCYQVLVGLYRPSDGERLLVDTVDRPDIWPLGQVKVTD